MFPHISCCANNLARLWSVFAFYGFIDKKYLELARNVSEVFAKNNFDLLYFTLDWHPANHCSFSKEGGIWPVHCVHYTEGASIPDCILADVDDSKLLFYTKGKDATKEEYGAFTDIEADNQNMFIAGDNVVVCGIASEYCVLETLKEVVRLSKAIGFNVSVFMDGVACIENHDVLLEYMKAEGIKEYK